MKGRTKLLVTLLATMGLMVVLTAGVAIAQAQITCTGGVCKGPQGDNLIRGTRSAALIIAKSGTDGVNGRGGSHSVLAATPCWVVPAAMIQQLTLRAQPQLPSGGRSGSRPRTW
jgi:hypothetical protein